MDRVAIKSRKPIYIYELITLIIVILISVALVLLVLFLPDNGEYAIVSVDGQVVYRIGLSTDSTTDIGSMQIIVKDKEVFVINSMCKDHICEYMGKISKSQSSIVCLPNKVIIYIDGKGDVDAVI